MFWLLIIIITIISTISKCKIKEIINYKIIAIRKGKVTWKKIYVFKEKINKKLNFQLKTSNSNNLIKVINK